MVRKRTVGLLLIGLLCSAAGCDGLSKEQRREIAKIEEHIRDHPDAIDAADQPGGLTALHVAMLNNYTELARWLLQRGANPNAPDGKGEAPLHAAAIFDRRPGCPMTRLLLAHGADVGPETLRAKLPCIAPPSTATRRWPPCCSRTGLTFRLGPAAGRARCTWPALPPRTSI